MADIRGGTFFTRRPHVGVLTMRIEGLSEPDTAPWADILDADERERAARFLFERDRMAFMAAHALLRVALSECIHIPPRDWRFVAGERGKPLALVQGSPAPLSFNLSHTNGMVGLGLLPLPGYGLGFDLEPLDRRAPLEIAHRYFRPEETAWLKSLAPWDQPAGFLRLWTLKEAFIKATGVGLAQDLASFWFDAVPPRIHFSGAVAERSEAWQFEQRVVGDRFIAAVGLRHAGTRFDIDWTEIKPLGLLNAGMALSNLIRYQPGLKGADSI